jgi:hypothetical protein
MRDFEEWKQQEKLRIQSIVELEMESMDIERALYKQEKE